MANINPKYFELVTAVLGDETIPVYQDGWKNVTPQQIADLVDIPAGLQLGETSTTAHRGDYGKTAYDHSQSAHAPADAEQNVNADWNATSGDAQILNKPTLGSAASAAVTDFAVAAKGVTNGDSHDHSGGDGAQIAYSSLSGTPSLSTVATSGSYTDLSNKPTIPTVTFSGNTTKAASVAAGTLTSTHLAVWDTNGNLVDGGAVPTSSGTPTWGGITGTLSLQTDLQSALDGKSATTHTHTGTYEPANSNIQSHISNTSNPHSTTAAQLGAEVTSNKGIANGYAGLDATGKVPSGQLPSFVDDVVEAANFAALPATGETGKIYVTLDTNLTYRWSGSAYVEISASLALGTTSSTAFRGDYGNTAYQHVSNSSNPHSTTAAQVGAVPTTRTVNSKALSADISLTYSDVGADASGAAATVAGNLTTHTSATGTSVHGLGSASTHEATDFATAGHNHTGTYQPVDDDLTAIAALAGTSGLLRKTAADTWTLDTETYITSTGVDDTAYGASWDGDTTHAPSKNAVYDKIESLTGGGISSIDGNTPTSLTGLLRGNGVDIDIATAGYHYITPSEPETLTQKTLNNYKETQHTAGTIGATWAPAIANGNIQYATLTSATNCTVTIPTLATGQSLTLTIKQPASGTAATVTFTGQTFANMASSIAASTTLGKLTTWTFYNTGVEYQIYCVVGA